MRYYDIQFGGGPQAYFSSLLNGQNNPNALQVQFSIEKVDAANIGKHSFLRIMGVPLKVLQQANAYNGVSVVMRAGFFYPGLPLAKQQSQSPRTGMMFQGTVFSAFGNWRGTDVSLDFLLVPGGPSSSADTGGGSSGGGAGNVPTQSIGRGPGRGLRRRSAPKGFGPVARPRDAGGLGGLGSIVGDALTSALGALGSDLGPIFQQLANSFGGGMFRALPANIIHNMQIGQPLESAIQQTLSTAFPGKNIVLDIAKGLTQTFQDAGFYQNAGQYFGFLKSLSASLAGGKGISAYVDGNKVHLTDWTQALGWVVLDYSDLIGQPTWCGIDQLQFSSVLRVDLSPPAEVILPATLFATAPVETNLGAVSMQTSLPQGCQLMRSRFVGDSRSPDGTQWRVDCWAAAGGATADAVARQQANAQANYDSHFKPPSPSPPSRLTARKTRVFA
jgi:hypothetical protein